MALFKDADMFMPKEATSFLAGLTGKASKKMEESREQRLKKARDTGEGIVDEALGIWDEAKKKYVPEIDLRGDVKEFVDRTAKEEKERIERGYRWFRDLLLGRRPEVNTTMPANSPTPPSGGATLPARTVRNRPSGPTYYDLLGLTPTATPTEIRQAYLTLSRINHPDKNRGSQTHKFQVALNTAYAVLGDRAKRMAYDIETGIIAAPAHY